MTQHPQSVATQQWFHLTPRRADGSRQSLLVDQFDYDAVSRRLRTQDWEIVVRDQPSGKHFRLRGAPCSLPNCNCDAEIVDANQGHAPAGA